MSPCFIQTQYSVSSILVWLRLLLLQVNRHIILCIKGRASLRTLDLNVVWYFLSYELNNFFIFYFYWYHFVYIINSWRWKHYGSFSIYFVLTDNTYLIRPNDFFYLTFILLYALHRTDWEHRYLINSSNFGRHCRSIGTIAYNVFYL